METDSDDGKSGSSLRPIRRRSSLQRPIPAPDERYYACSGGTGHSVDGGFIGTWHRIKQIKNATHSAV